MSEAPEHESLRKLIAEVRSLTTAEKNRALKLAFKAAGLPVKSFERGQGKDNGNFVWVTWDMSPGETPAEEKDLLADIEAAARAVEPGVTIRSKFARLTSAELAHAKSLGL